jgi:hypothetical protein
LSRAGGSGESIHKTREKKQVNGPQVFAHCDES